MCALIPYAVIKAATDPTPTPKPSLTPEQEQRNAVLARASKFS